MYVQTLAIYSERILSPRQRHSPPHRNSSWPTRDQGARIVPGDVGRAAKRRKQEGWKKGGQGQARFGTRGRENVAWREHQSQIYSSHGHVSTAHRLFPLSLRCFQFWFEIVSLLNGHFFFFFMAYFYFTDGSFLRTGQ